MWLRTCTRNPLHVLAGCARFIKDTCHRGDAIYEDVCTVLENATAMSNLLSAIVEWTSAVAEDSEPLLEPTNVVDLCKREVGCSIGARKQRSRTVYHRTIA